MLCPEAKNFSEKGLEFAQTKCFLTAVNVDQIEFERIAPQFDAVLVRFNTLVGAKLMGGHSRLKSILSPTTGLNHIDLEAANLLKINVFHLQGQKQFLKGIGATSEHTIALMLCLLRKIPESIDSVKKGNWEPGPFRGTEVSCKTLGIVGFGRLGSKVAKIAKAMGMKIIAYDPYVKNFPKDIVQKKRLNSVLAESDIISLHVPLNNATNKLLKDREFKMMKKGAFLINTSRGEIIYTNALLKALNSNHLGGAALDVLVNEHSIGKKDHPIIEYSKNNSNLIITPHISGSTYESVEKTDLFIIKKFFKSLYK